MSQREASLSEIQERVLGDSDVNLAIEHWVKRALEGCNQTMADEDLLDILKIAFNHHSTTSIEESA